MNETSVKILRESLKNKAHDLLCVLEDIAKHDHLDEHEAVAAIGLMKMAEWEDPTCSYIDLLAVDYPNNDRNEVQTANLTIVRNFMQVFSEE